VKPITSSNLSKKNGKIKRMAALERITANYTAK